MVIVFGHRGAPGYPRRGENTVGSFKKALLSGATGLEFDVRRSADGRLVVIHDETIDRTTNGKGIVSRLSYEQLRQFDAGDGESIPLLSDVLDRFGSQCLLNVELKVTGIASDVSRLILEKRLEHQVLVSSFDWDDLEALAPIPIALLSSKLHDLIATARRLGAAAIHPRRELVTPTLITTAHDAGLRVHAWTVNEPAEMIRLKTFGIDGIFTDFPARAKNV